MAQAGRGARYFTDLTRIANDGGNIPFKVKLVVPGTPKGQLVHAKVGPEGSPFTRYGEVFAEAKGTIVKEPFGKIYHWGHWGRG